MKKKQKLLIGLAVMVGISFIAGCKASSNSAGKAEEKRANEDSPAVMAETWAAPADMEMDGSNISGAEQTETAQRYRQAYDSEYMNSEEYGAIAEEGFKSVSDHPLSTFSVDVDTASYSNIRRMINRGEVIPKDAVRIEEMINYFHYNYGEPQGEEPLAVTTELSDCPWNPDHQLLLVGLKAEEIDFDSRPMSNLVFLLDVSGSMYDEDKLPLVQKSFSMLTDELTENDRVSIVTYAGYEEVVLEGARGDEKSKIREALERLEAGGSTAGEAGINMAYELAETYFIKGGNNRVILATDGDLNVGISSEAELKKLIEEKRKSGVHLSVLGFGTGNLKDNKMETLADNGDGNYAYIDNQMEAKKVLVEEMGGTLLTVAKDVKIQIEFNPAQIAGYRLIGYENRALADRDFSDDTVDAGEIGSGHRVTALYEIIRAGAGTTEIDLKYQSGREEGEVPEPVPEETAGNSASKYADELLTINIRYKDPGETESKLFSVPVEADKYQKELPENLRFASAVAEFGMLLRDSEYKGDSSFEQVIALISELPDRSMDDYMLQFKQLVLKAMDR